MKQNSKSIKFKTCYLLDAYGDSMTELADMLPNSDASKVNEFLEFLETLNQKHVKILEKDE